MGIFSEIIYRPLFNLTIGLYNTVGFQDLGLTIVLMTVVVRLLLLPMSLKTARTQKAIAQLNPEIEKLKAQHKNDMSAQSEAVMRLYREKGVSPLGGCLPLLLQFPLLFGLYRVFINIFNPESLNSLYAFVNRPDAIHNLVLGHFDISSASPVLAIGAGVTQFIQGYLTSHQQQGQNNQAAAMGRQMMYLLPIMIVVIGWNLPGGLALYWIATTLFSIAEQLYLKRS